MSKILWTYEEINFLMLLEKLKNDLKLKDVDEKYFYIPLPDEKDIKEIQQTMLSKTLNWQVELKEVIKNIRKDFKKSSDTFHKKARLPRKLKKKYLKNIQRAEPR